MSSTRTPPRSRLIEAGLNGECVAFEQFDASGVEQRWLMHLETDTVPCPVMHGAERQRRVTGRKASIETVPNHYLHGRSVHFRHRSPRDE